MSEWDSLYSVDSEAESTKTNVESTNKKPPKKSKSKKKAESTKTNVESTTQNKSSKNSELKILDTMSLRAEIYNLRKDLGMKELLALLTLKSVKSLSKCKIDNLTIQRTPAANAIIRLFRHLKKEGYV